MSDLVAVAVFGPAHQNNGDPRNVDLFGELHVGGSGVWIFRRMDGATREPIRLRSHTRAATELRAGFALSGLVAGVDEPVEEILGVDWASHDVDVDERTLEALARLVDDVSVGLWVCEPGPAGTLFEPTDWEGTRWSVAFGAASQQRQMSQWG